MKQYHLLISGDVQGVGYRAWMMREAKHLDIVGWVKNLGDGAVEAMIQGAKKTVVEMLEKVKRGPDIAWVERVDVDEVPVDPNLLTFEVIY